VAVVTSALSIERAAAASGKPAVASERATMMHDAVIIGAGHNGLVAAAYLARAGRSVLVVERRELAGGACVSEHPWPGWTVSTASYVCSLLHPDIISELDLKAYGYQAYRKDPSSFTVLGDGRSLVLGRDRQANRREIAAWSQADVDGYERCDAAIVEHAAELFNAMNDDEPRFERLSGAAQSMFLGSAATFVERYIETPVLQAAIASEGIIGTFAGPRDAGTGYVMAHHFAGRALGVQGAWGYVRGGMGSISAALAAVATKQGAQVRTGAAVSTLLVDGGRAAGVALEDGTEIRSRAVLSNADPRTTFARLVPSGTLDAEFLKKVSDWRDEGSSLKLNLALGELPRFAGRSLNGDGMRQPGSATIHITPDIDYLQRAFQDAAAGLPSREPFLECFLQTPSDPSLAPPGKHLLSIFAQYFPYNRSDGPWTSSKRETAADLIVETLGRYAPNVPAAVEERQILAPPDLEDRFNLPRGHIFHGELLPGQIFEKRFAVRTPLPGLYLCGSGTHPGGCVSGIPGWRGARACLQDLAHV